MTVWVKRILSGTDSRTRSSCSRSTHNTFLFYWLCGFERFFWLFVVLRCEFTCIDLFYCRAVLTAILLFDYRVWTFKVEDVRWVLRFSFERLRNQCHVISKLSLFFVWHGSRLYWNPMLRCPYTIVEFYRSVRRLRGSYIIYWLSYISFLLLYCFKIFL